MGVTCEGGNIGAHSEEVCYHGVHVAINKYALDVVLVKLLWLCTLGERPPESIRSRRHAMKSVDNDVVVYEWFNPKY